ncbi:hypothetical protein, partial [Mesorhizobium japonicum]|uniref:hypothetical protein n=1 Tax=Mesorhizobium japonicum TaxID=2066070 RepID=UPI003B5B114B
PFTVAAEQQQNADKLTAGEVQIAAARQQLAAAQQAGIDVSAQAAQLDAQSAQLVAGSTLLSAASDLTMVSKDGSTALGLVQFSDTLFDLPAAEKAAVSNDVTSAHIDGVRIDASSEIANSLDGIVGPGEVTGVLIAAVV